MNKRLSTPSRSGDHNKIDLKLSIQMNCKQAFQASFRNYNKTCYIFGIIIKLAL